MRITLKRIIGFAALLGCLGAQAMEPLPPKVEIITVLKGLELYITVENQENFPVTVDLTPGARTSISFAHEQLKLTPGEKKEVALRVTESPKGLHVLHVESTITTEQGLKMSGPQHYQPILAKGNQITKLTYEEAFLSRRLKIVGKSAVPVLDLGGARYAAPINPLSFRAGLIPAGMKIDPLVSKDIRLFTQMKLRVLPSAVEVGEGNHNPRLEEALEEHSDLRDEEEERLGALFQHRIFPLSPKPSKVTCPSK